MPKRRVLAAILLLCILISGIPKPQANAMQARPKTAMPAYNAAAAIAYAKAHAFDAQGACAEFVSTCLGKGGIVVPNMYGFYSSCEPRYWGSSFGVYTNPYICSSSLLRWLSERYPVITAPKHSDMELGDVILMYATGNPDGHAGIITGFDGDMPLYTAHNTHCLDNPVNDLPQFLVKMNGLKAEGTCTGEHVKGNYLWPTEQHPHYLCYSCALCGDTYSDGTTKTLTTCAQCMTKPSAPILYIGEKAYLKGEYAQISWSSVDCATAYRLVIYKNGISVLDKNMWLSTSYSFYCDAAARYEVAVYATNRAAATPSGRGTFYVHSYTGTVTAPTCTEQGYTTFRCICGASYVASYKPALGHEWDSGVPITAPTPLLPGEKRCTCIRCPATILLPMEPLGLCEAGENCAGNQFTDMTAPTAWSHEGIEYVFHRELFDGTSPTTFEPNAVMTRAMLVTVLWRYDGRTTGYLCDFNDVAADTWYTDAVAWAAECGVVNGMQEKQFAPDDSITREQLAAILFRYCEENGLTTEDRADLSGFTDAETVSTWSLVAVRWAVANKLIAGTTVKGELLLDPRGGATRAQVATILMRFCRLTEKTQE